MIVEPFRPGSGPTLGVELELQIVDARSMDLRGAIEDLLPNVPASIRGSVKPEFHACCVEVNTGICRDVDEVGRDLGAKLESLGRVADGLGLRFAWGGTHPFGHWRDQPIVPSARYRALAEDYRETVLRQLTFGLHVHVGVKDGDAAIRACNRLAEYLPALLALSANSPFWCGRATGLHSHRAEVLASTPIGGAPPRARDWDDYSRLIARLAESGAIRSCKDLWWDVRPSPEFGTVEVRVCDMPADLPTTLALTALIQCLVHDLARRDDEVPSADETTQLILRQNHWRAARHGLDAILIDPSAGRARPARRWVGELIAQLRSTAEELGCSWQLHDALGLAEGVGGSGHQLAVFEESGSTVAVARYLAGDRSSRLGVPDWNPLATTWTRDWRGGVAFG
jgi:carboxylate-amine ligase